MANSKELLIGKWQPLEDCCFAGNSWHFYAHYEEGKSYYCFDGEHFTSHGTDYYEDNALYPYRYDPETQSIYLEQETIRVIGLSKNRLLLELSIGIPGENGAIRVSLRRYSKKK